MLKPLYRKLHIIFLSSVMLIITVILALIFLNTLHTEKVNESSFFQRMTTLLIYQFEDISDSKDINNIVHDYEEEYKIFSLVKTPEKGIIYQSNIAFPTNIQKLLEIWEQQYQAQTSDVFSSNNGTITATSQEGFYEITGTNHDNYLVIPATIVSSEDKIYETIFIYQINGILECLWKYLPFGMSIWFASLIIVILLTGILLKKAFTPTESVLKSQKEFIATASHELKSPLAVILAYVDILQSRNLPDESSKKAVEVIDSECMRLSRLVKEMLLLASSDAKTWTLHKEEVNIDTLLITLYETYEPVCMKNNIQLKLELSDNIYPPLNTDEERLLQILNIFMDNAIQHNEHNTLIEIHATTKSKYISFSIVDHGKGISDEEKHYIFNRFYSGDKSHTNKANFGLGLSIAQELTNMLNGKIQVSDTTGGGTTFTIKLPLK